MSADRPYHHGDLRRVLLEAAAEMIVEHGPARLNLRELARRAGVSHAAPTHHFRDKAGLLTALAAQGYELLATMLGDALEGGSLDLKELGVRYVEFAAEHPAHFEVMFRPDLYRPDDPNVVTARDATTQHLRAGVGGVPRARTGRDPEIAALAAWSLAHGFATLRRSGNLEPALRGQEDAAGLFRAMAALLFAGKQQPT